MRKTKRILVIDDESDICITLSNVLEGDGFVVHTFDDPLLALEDFREDLYDLLILDIKMKKISGFELYKEIKKIDNKVQVCFLTSSQINCGSCIDEPSDLKKNQFIQIPIQNEELIKIINEITS